MAPILKCLSLLIHKDPKLLAKVTWTPEQSLTIDEVLPPEVSKQPVWGQGRGTTYKQNSPEEDDKSRFPLNLRDMRH